MVIRRQFAFSVRPDFVQHSAEIEKAAHFVVWTAEVHLTPREYSLCVFPPDSSALKQISHQVLSLSQRKRRVCRLREPVSMSVGRRADYSRSIAGEGGEFAFFPFLERIKGRGG